MEKISRVIPEGLKPLPLPVVEQWPLVCTYSLPCWLFLRPQNEWCHWCVKATFDVKGNSTEKWIATGWRHWLPRQMTHFWRKLGQVLIMINFRWPVTQQWVLGIAWNFRRWFVRGSATYAYKNILQLCNRSYLRFKRFYKLILKLKNSIGQFEINNFVAEKKIALWKYSIKHIQVLTNWWSSWQSEKHEEDSEPICNWHTVKTGKISTPEN